MKTNKIVGFMTSLFTVAVFVSAHAQESEEVLERIRSARTIAGSQWAVAADYFCKKGAVTPNQNTDSVLEPMKIFDNLYFIGRTGTVVYAITTPNGIILIDSGYIDDLETVLMPGMDRLGLDPARIEYVIIAHGHADHFGGAAYLQEQYGARIVMGASDWDLLERASVEGSLSVPVPDRDLIAMDGGSISLGGVEVTTIFIPGHTPGSLGLIFPVKDGEITHRAALFGGTILNPIRITNEGLKQYRDSIENFSQYAWDMKVDVEIQNHPLYDEMQNKISLLKTRGTGGGRHPFVVGQEAYQTFLGVMSECTRVEQVRRAAR